MPDMSGRSSRSARSAKLGTAGGDAATANCGLGTVNSATRVALEIFANKPVVSMTNRKNCVLLCPYRIARRRTRGLLTSALVPWLGHFKVGLVYRLWRAKQFRTPPSTGGRFAATGRAP